VRWLTSDGEVTPSRLERVSAARGLLAAAFAALALLALAAAVFPAAALAAYHRAGEGIRAARTQPQQLGRAAAAALLVIAALLGVTYGVHRLTGAPLAALTRDPTRVLGGLPWIGLMSNLGVLIWASAAAICCFGAAVLSERGAERRRIEFLWVSGVLTAVLVLDDLLQLHEGVVPRITGWPESAIVSVYPILFLAYLARYAATILAAEWLLLLASAALLAASIGIDAVFTGERRAFVEDGSKLAGIVLWLAFYARTAQRWLARAS
jgi:hypothetical protein